MSSDSALSIDSGLSPEQAPAANHLDPSVRRRRVKSHTSWRIIPQIDQDPRLITYVQTLPGRILLFICFTVVLHALGGDPLVAALAATCAYADRYRRYLIASATSMVLYRHGFWIDTGLVALVADQEDVAARINQPMLLSGMLVLVLLLSCSLLHFWRRIITVPLFRRSTLCLVSCFLGLILLAQSPISSGLPRVLLWSFLVTLLPYLWFLAYALAEAGARGPIPTWQRLGIFQPFWGSTLTPYGKSVLYLEKFEAKTPGDLAVTQLKGLKLAIWTGFLSVCLNGFGMLIHQQLNIPRFDNAFRLYVAGTGYPWYTCWTSLVAFFVEDLLSISVSGGIIIACARMAGFRLLRNTYRPLEATTIAEFWNRYYFYFKELLVDHFFYPTFFRFFRNHKRLRLFFATFIAACVGNWIYHLIRDAHFIAELGFWRAVLGDQSHAFYTFILATGIAISQLRGRTREVSPGWLRGRALPLIGVVLFFCVLHVFDAPLDREHSISQRGQFLLHLFGIDTWT